jgi:hypothetical protein
VRFNTNPRRNTSPLRNQGGLPHTIPQRNTNPQRKQGGKRGRRSNRPRMLVELVEVARLQVGRM